MDAGERVVRIEIDEATLRASAARANQIIQQIGSGSTIAGLTQQFTGLGGAASGATSAITAANNNLNTMAGAASTAGSASASAASSIRETGEAATHAGGGILEMARHLGTMTLAMAGLGFITAGIHEMAEAFVEAANEATEVAGRLALVTNGTKEFADAQASVAAIANQTRASLTDVGELYQKIGIQAGHLGASQKDVTTMTKTFAETLKVSASTTQQSQAAMRQLGEAFDMNGLQGRHFIAMQTDNIRFMQLLAASMGVTQGKLKELATDGKVTGEELKKALTNPTLAADLQKQFDKMPVGFADVRMAIKNTLVQLAGDFMEGSGLNTSLRSLYDKIADFGTSAGPAFEKIGIAARAAFTTFAPVAAEALAAIRPVFSFVLDNAPELIKLLKVSAEAWIAYRIATASVAAVSLVSTFVTQAQSLAMFLDLARGGTGVVGLLKGAFLLASEGVNTFTASLLANPFTALAVVITATIALLYEFRDSITVSSDGVTSLGDLMRAAWEKIGPLITNTIAGIESAVSGAWNAIKTAFGAVGDFIYIAFKTPVDSITSLWNDAFGDLPLSFNGILVGAARVLDALVGQFRGTVAVIAVLFDELPGAIYSSMTPAGKAIVDFVGTAAGYIGKLVGLIGDAFADFAKTAGSVLNSVLSTLAGWANDAIGIVNKLIDGANKLGGNFQKVGTVKAPTIETPKAAPSAWSRLGTDLGRAFNSGFGHEAESATRGLIDRAHQIGLSRRPGAAQPDGKPTMPHHGAEDPAGDKDDDKKAAKKAQQEKEFWQTLENQLATAKLYGIEAAKVTEEQKLQKILGRDLNEGEKTRVDNMVLQIAAAKAITDLMKSAFELRNKDTLLAQRQLGLTDDQSKIQDAVDAKKLSALNAGVDITTKDYQTSLAAYQAELERNQAIEKRIKLTQDAITAAKGMDGSTFGAGFKIKDLQDQKSAFLDAFNAGEVKDAWGVPITNAVADAIKAGFDKGIKDAGDAPFKTALDYAKTAMASNGSVDQKRDAAQKEYDGLIKKLNSAHDAGKMDDDTFRVSVDQAGDDLKKKFADIGDEFSEKMSQVGDVLGMLSNAIGGKLGGIFGNAKGVTDSLGNFAKTQTDFETKFTTAFGKDSDFVKSLGHSVGGAVAGLGIGDSIGKLESSLGIKGGETGAKIGGGIGGLVAGPIGAAVGGVLGGLFGSLFHKVDHSNASFTTDSTGKVVVGGVTGTTAALSAASSGAAGEVLAGLSKIASSIGGTLSGVPNLTIGTWDSKWRVLDNQQTTAGLNANNFSMGNNLHDFGSDEASAVAYAVAQALKQGVITGLDNFSTLALKSLDSDSAVSLIQSWADAMKNYKAMIDPVGSAISAVVDPLTTLRASMVAVGAATDDLNKLDAYRAKALDAALKQETSTLTDLLNTLNGDGSGRSKLAQLNDDMAQYDDYKKKIMAGDTSIDQSDFSKLVNEIFSLNKDVNGTSTSQSQSLLSDLRSTTQLLKDNITSVFVGAGADNPATTTADQAAQAQTNALLSQQLNAQTLGNSYLAQIAQNTASANDNTVAYSPALLDKLNAANGSYLGPAL